jgi:hypothetical protein
LQDAGAFFHFRQMHQKVLSIALFILLAFLHEHVSSEVVLRSNSIDETKQPATKSNTTTSKGITIEDAVKTTVNTVRTALNATSTLQRCGGLNSDDLSKIYKFCSKGGMKCVCKNLDRLFDTCLDVKVINRNQCPESEIIEARNSYKGFIAESCRSLNVNSMAPLMGVSWWVGAVSVAVAAFI